MISLIFAGLTLAAVLVATFMSHTRKAILALWGAGLGVGAIYLTMGAEFLAVIQWLVSTLIAISFVFFSVMFGEYHAPSEKYRKKIHLLFLAVLIGGAFTLIIVKGFESLPKISLESMSSGNDLKAIGKKLTEEHLLPLEVLALMLFLVLVGGGVVARSEGDD